MAITISGSSTCYKSFSPSPCNCSFLTRAARFDFSKLEWLNAEAFPDPPQGERRYLDLVAKLPTRQVVPAMRPGEEYVCDRCIACRNRVADVWRRAAAVV